MPIATGVVKVHLQAYLQWVVKSGRQGPFQRGLAFDSLWTHPRQTSPLSHALLTVTLARRDGAGFISCPLSLRRSASLVAQLVKIFFVANQLSEEALQIAVKRTEAKSKGEKERYTHLNAEF